MKKTLTILLVALTLASLTLTFAPHVSAQTNDIKVINYSYHIDWQSGMLIVVGEVQNTGTTTYQLGSPAISGSVYSADGTDQADSPGQVYTVYMVPGQKMPFEIDFNSPANSQDGTWWTASISNIVFVINPPTATTSYPYPDVQITSQSSTIDTTATARGTFWVNGELKNTGTQWAQHIFVIATFYNSTGQTVWYGYSAVLNVTVGNSIPFQLGAFDANMSIINPQQQIAGYLLTVRTGDPILTGTAPDVSAYTTTGGTVQSSSDTQSSSSSQSNSSSTPAPSSTSISSATPIPTNQQSSGVTNPKSSFDYNWLIYAAIIIVIIAAVAITIIRLPRRKPAETKTKHKTTTSTSEKPQGKVRLNTAPLFKYFMRNLVCL